MSSQTNTAWKEAFTRRVLVMRKASGMTQQECARALGVTLSGYQHFEASERTGKPGRSYMPHHIIPAFCRLTGFSLDFLFGVEDRGATVVSIERANNR